jgi:hypothetical protein
LVVHVTLCWLFPSHTALEASVLINTQVAWCLRGEAASSAVANEVALIEKLNEMMLAVARDGAGIANSCRYVGIRRIFRWWVAVET